MVAKVALALSFESMGLVSDYVMQSLGALGWILGSWISMVGVVHPSPIICYYLDLFWLLGLSLRLFVFWVRRLVLAGCSLLAKFLGSFFFLDDTQDEKTCPHHSGNLFMLAVQNCIFY